ncbi:exo-alpha-sialidase [Oleiharenicola sp. Vm1]|uniref:exo-alpha-sialidase n=1 Tax=Oleiharenicola sp. Vm1 TaxID=3398393 RepID=UPI0039F50550
MQTEVWTRAEGGYASHFVYGIGVTWDDTVLIACEARVGGGDADEKDLLVKRSTDQGRTWSPDQVIEGASDHASWSNPTFVTDGLTTYLFYTQSVSSDLGRVFVRTTRDNGRTWSERTELTHLWTGNPHHWTQLSAIGHGIKKLKEPHRGRVLVPFHHRREVDRPPVQRGYGNDVILLGPDGWEIAGGPPLEPARGTNEARLAERADGSLLLIARQAAGNNQLRARSVSSDGGRSWSAWETQADLRGTVCDSGLLRFSDAHLLYSFPAGVARSAQQRQDLTIKASIDGGEHWNAGRMLHRGQATYSDLARDSHGNIYCIYGRDGTNFMGDRVFVARFNLEWAVGRPVATVLVDDRDAGFAAAGDWRETAVAGRFGPTARIARAEPGRSVRAEWTASLAAGSHEVLLRWPECPGASTAATVELLRGDQVIARQAVDQAVDPGAWFFVGTVALEAADTVRVRLTADAGTLVADAVMFQQH